MVGIKQSFVQVVGFSLASLTLYLVLRYIILEPHNHCRMTFMMEPPKFFAVPVNTSNSFHEEIDETIFIHKDYKLFMYSEFDFPQLNDPHQDLKDSMPVLFVPGNAGSHQQTRSLASTSIRRQLRSLEAAKFIFYTVSFGEQLSGINGKLLIEQIYFVGKAIKQIRENHLNQTGGIILIGHSVGGFICKALVAQSNFLQESVGLIISLAGPLVSLPIFFDSDVRNLYERTNRHWNEMTRGKEVRPLAISITGGYTDRLVPPHLAMDPNFDISITTNALQGVWLPTDHVPITWCRELMQKLSIIMSSIIDRKTSKLKTIGREQIVSTLKKQLIQVHDVLKQNPKLEKISVNWTNTKSFSIISEKLFYHDQRYKMINELKIINLEANEDLFILVDHVEDLPERWITGCDNRSEHESNRIISCTNRFELSDLVRSIPSRYYEPQSSFLLFSSKLVHSHNILSIIIDLVPNNNRFHETGTAYRRMPETFSYFRAKPHNYIRDIYLPTMFEYIYYQAVSLFTGQRYLYEHIDAKTKYPIHYMRFYFSGFKYLTQTFIINLDAESCSNLTPDRGLMLFGAPWNHESYHSPLTSDDLSKLKMNLRLMESYTRHEYRNESAYIELFIDGNCSYNLSFKFNFLDLFNIIVQHRLVSIVTCLATLLIVRITLDLSVIICDDTKFISNKTKNSDIDLALKSNTLNNQQKLLIHSIIEFLVTGIILELSNAIFYFLAPNIKLRDWNPVDEIVITSSIYTFSCGAILGTEFVLRKLIWFLAQISFYSGSLNHSTKGNKLNLMNIDNSRSSHQNIASNNHVTSEERIFSSSYIANKHMMRSLNNYFYLYTKKKMLDITGIMVIIAIVLGVFWCTLWLSLGISTILVIKSVTNKKNSIAKIKKIQVNGRINFKEKITYNSPDTSISRLDINLLLLAILCVIPTIPDALITLHDKKILINSTTSKMLDLALLTSIPALILTYVFMHRSFCRVPWKQRPVRTEESNMFKTISSAGLLFAPILLIQSDVYFLSVTQLTTLMWLAIH